MARRPKPWFRKQTKTWMVTIRGEKITLAKGRDNEQAAWKQFHALMANLPDDPADINASVASILEPFLDWSHRHQSPETARFYDFYLNAFDQWCGDIKVKDLKRYHVTKWLESKTWGPSTQYNGIRSVVRALNWACEQQYLTENPLKGIKRPRPQARERGLTGEEYQALLAAAKPAFRNFLFALRETGARPAELRNLTWDQVHDDRFVIHQHKTVDKVQKPRVIYLTPAMIELAAALREDSQSDYVFLNCHGKPWTTNALRLQMTRLRRKLGLPDDLCCYMARHAYATHAIIGGVDIATLAELMGHRDTSMISRVYGHLAEAPDHLKAAAEKAAQSPATRKRAS